MTKPHETQKSSRTKADPEKRTPVFRKDHAPPNIQTMIRFNLIGSWSSAASKLGGPVHRVRGRARVRFAQAFGLLAQRGELRLHELRLDPQRVLKIPRLAQSLYEVMHGG